MDWERDAPVAGYLPASESKHNQKGQWLEIVKVNNLGFLSTFPRFSNTRAVVSHDDCSKNNI